MIELQWMGMVWHAHVMAKDHSDAAGPRRGGAWFQQSGSWLYARVLGARYEIRDVWGGGELDLGDE